MIDALDNVLTDLIQSRVSTLSGPTQIGFAPPNEDWRLGVVAAGEERLNLYLYDLRENLKLRSNERTFEAMESWYREHRAPPIVNCMYLITAWSPVTTTPGVEASIDEHRLLASVTEVLLRHRSLLVADVYGPGQMIPSGRSITSVPLLLQPEELPVDVAQPDGAHDMLEFWSSMRGFWRPTLKLSVALPIFPLDPPHESPMVTTLFGDYQQEDLPVSSEAWLSVGGRVLAGGAGDAVEGASVQIEGLNPPTVQIVRRRVVTSANGRFLFPRLRTGSYKLTATSMGKSPLARTVDLPAETGEYDLRFP